MKKYDLTALTFSEINQAMQNSQYDPTILFARFVRTDDPELKALYDTVYLDEDTGRLAISQVEIHEGIDHDQPALFADIVDMG